MDNIKAIEIRKSIRHYSNEDISNDEMAIITQMVNDINCENGLSISIRVDGEAMDGIISNAFSGVKYYLELKGRKDDSNLSEMIGYFGEKLVIEMTKLNIGSCWVTGTYKKSDIPNDNEDQIKVVGVITFGKIDVKNVNKKTLLNKFNHRKDRGLEHFYTSDYSEIPEWFMEGIKCVKKAPSAINLQPIYFEYKNKDEIVAKRRNGLPFTFVDLGIAKYHFEQGAKGKFELGDLGKFIKE